MVMSLDKSGLLSQEERQGLYAIPNNALCNSNIMPVTSGCFHGSFQKVQNNLESPSRA